MLTDVRARTDAAKDGGTGAPDTVRLPTLDITRRVDPRGTTSLPKAEPLVGTEPRRTLGKMSRDELFTLLGAGISAICTTLVLFKHFTSLSGRLGFVVVGFLVFIAIYALLVALDNETPAVVDKVMSSLLTASAVVAFFALASVVVFTLGKGFSALWRLNLYTQDMRTTGPLDPLSQGGIAHAIVGTLIIISISLIICVPLGITSAVFLNETRGPLTNLVRSIVTAMTALPSIIAGLFIFASWVLVLGFERSGLAAALAVSIMMLPIIIRSADVVLRLVAGSLREASAATGAPRWRTVWHVVLPTARSGLATSVILGMARGIGETAPVLLTSGVTATMNVDPSRNAMISLPLAAFEFVRSPQPEQIARGFATAAVLMILVLVLFAIARILGGRPAGHLSNRQRRRAAQQSLRDLERIESLGAPPHTVAPNKEITT